MGVSEKYDRYMNTRERRLTLDHCPGCRRLMALVLEVGGGPDVAGGGRFLSCWECVGLYVRAQGGRAPVDSQHARVLAREVLRLREQLGS